MSVVVLVYSLKYLMAYEGGFITVKKKVATSHVAPVLTISDTRDARVDFIIYFRYEVENVFRRNCCSCSFPAV